MKKRKNTGREEHLSKDAALEAPVTVGEYSFPLDAHLAKIRLEAEGIPVLLADEEIVSANWLYSNAVGGVKLKVRPDDEARARGILDSEPPTHVKTDPWEESGLKCPRCGSVHAPHERFKTRWVFLSWVIMGFPLPFFKRRRRCDDCGRLRTD